MAPYISTIVFAVCLVFPPFWPLLILFFPFLLYFISSNFLLHYPTLLFGQRKFEPNSALFRRVSRKCTSTSTSTSSTSPPSLPPLPLCHRLGSGEHPENSLLAASSLLRLSQRSSSSSVGVVPVLHLDVTPTLDGRLLVLHDLPPFERNVLKLTGFDVDPRRTQFKDIPKRYKSRIPVNPLADPGGYIETGVGPGAGAERAGICEFGELLQLVGNDADLVIEIWGTGEGIVESWPGGDCVVTKVRNDIVRARGGTDGVVWGNAISDEIRTRCERVDPSIPVLCTTSQYLMTVLLYYTCLLPFFPLPKSPTVYLAVLISPSRYTRLFLGALPPFCRVDSLSYHSSSPLSRFFRTLPSLTVTASVLVLNYVTRVPSMWQHLRQRGYPVVATLSNGPEEWEYAKDVNMTGVITDYPERMKRTFSLPARDCLQTTATTTIVGGGGSSNSPGVRSVWTTTARGRESTGKAAASATESTNTF